MNGGRLLFVVGLVAGSAEVKRIGAPVMGIAILIGLAALGARLWADAGGGTAIKTESPASATATAG